MNIYQIYPPLFCDLLLFHLHIILHVVFYTPYIDDAFLTIMKLCIIGLLLWQQRCQKKCSGFQDFFCILRLQHPVPCLSTGAGSQQCQKLRMDQLSDYWKQLGFGVPPWIHRQSPRAGPQAAMWKAKGSEPSSHEVPLPTIFLTIWTVSIIFLTIFNFFPHSMHIFTFQLWAYYRALPFFSK